MSRRNSSPKNSSVVESNIPVGIDVGSQRARVAVGTAVGVGAAEGVPLFAATTNVTVVSNTLGHRSSVAVAAVEGGGESDKTSPESSHIIFGEAALRLLQKEKKAVVPVRQVLQQENNPGESSLATAEAFLGHLGRLAVDATATSLHQLRIVASVPVDASDSYVAQLKASLPRGMGRELKSSGQTMKNKKHLLLGLLSDPAAICLAHGLLNSDTKKNIVVVDGGASGVTLSHLKPCSTTSNVWRVVHYERHTSISGPAICTLLAKFVVSQFERKHRLAQVWDSKKSRYKVLNACQQALPSLQKKTAVHITIDGLYEGMDCHIPVSPPRWDMLLRPMVTRASQMLQQFGQKVTLDEEVVVDAVVCAGSLAALLKPLADQVFSSNHIFRGLSTVVPEEAVALGCARHAAACLSHGILQHQHSHQVHVQTSPIAIGIGPSDTSSDGMETVIDQGTPLPAHVVHQVSALSVGSQQKMGVWQLTPHKKQVATLEDFPTEGTVEILMELTSQGQLSVALEGGPLVVI